MQLTLWVVAGLIGLLLGVGVWWLPEHFASQVQDKLVRTAAKRGVQLELRHLYLTPWHATLDGVALGDVRHPQAAPFARVARVRVNWQIDGFWAPRLSLQRVVLTSPEVHLTRDLEGRSNVDGVLERLLAPRDDDDERAGGGGWRRYLSKHLPDVEVQHLRAGIDDARGPGSAQVAGVDLHHLRVEDASLELTNRALVQEQADLAVTAAARFAGVEQTLKLQAHLRWPEISGDLTLQLPQGVALQWHDYRLQAASVQVRSDGHVLVQQVALAREATATEGRERGSGRLQLDVAAIDLQLSRLPAPIPELPESIQRKLPGPVRQALRHVAVVTIQEPVVVADRTSMPLAKAATDDDDDEATPEPPPQEAGPPSRKPGRRGPTATSGAAKPPPEQRGDGKVVREALAAKLRRGSERLEHRLQGLRELFAAMPVPVVAIEHGRARFADQRPGVASEVSDVSGRIERKADGSVAVRFDFHVAGKTDANSLTGEVNPAKGESRWHVKLDQLPLQPYAAVLPSSLITGPQSAVRNADVTATLTGRNLSLAGKATVAHLDALLPRISLQPLQDLSVTAAGQLDLDVAAQKLKLAKAELTVGKVHVLLEAAMQRFATAPVFDLQLRIPTVACQDAADSVPAGFAPMLEGLRCEGELSYDVRASLDTAHMESLKFELGAALQTVRITSMGKFVRFDIFDAPFEHHARQKDASLYTFNTGPGTELWAPLESITPNFVKVLTTTEDGGFFGHRGFCLDCIRGAMVDNLKRGRFARGASTITQQLVKNLFFVEREKTISRKVQEAVVTWQIERSLTKQQILELYLNIMELGPRIYGIKAAALHYFDRAPADLTLLQTIWLGSIVPNPRAFYHQFRDGKISENWQSYLCWIGDVMLRRDKILADERARLGTCQVVFGAGPDGSEQPAPEPGLGHEGEVDEGEPAAPKPADQRRAPSLPPYQQP
jgi:hypothetical protein